MAAGVAGDLDMRVAAGERLDMVREVALHDLHMVKVELELQIGVADLVDDPHRVGRRVQEIAGDVAVVDRLDDDGDAVARRALGRVTQILDVHPLGRASVAALRHEAGHRVHEPATGRLGVDERLVDPGAKLRLAARQRRHPALARGPVSGRHVEQRLGEPVPAQCRRDGFWRVVVGAEIFDRLKTAFRGGSKPVEKPDVLKDKAQIRGEFRHGASSRLRPATLPVAPAKHKTHRQPLQASVRRISVRRNGIDGSSPALQL